MKKKPTNIAASIRQRLLNLARDKREDFNTLITRFAIERLLYRIGISILADQFCLKGAHLFAAWTGQPHRPTRDVDFLGFGSPAPDDVAERIRLVLAETKSRPGTSDGLDFDVESMVAAEIREKQKYGGVRVKMDAELAGARIRLQIDVGFGDAVTPSAVHLIFPTLLDDPDLPPPALSSYPQPTVVAEKTEALTSLGLTNSRLKDFYDLWTISRNFRLSADECVEAIRQTFERRQTEVDAEPLALTEIFWGDKAVQARWISFAKKNLGEEEKDFSAGSMLADLRLFLLPLLKSAARRSSMAGHWDPEKQIWTLPHPQAPKPRASRPRRIKPAPLEGFLTGQPNRKEPSKRSAPPDIFRPMPTGSRSYWISGNGVRHNAQCSYYQKSSVGHFGTKKEGVACRRCGG